MLTRKNIFKGLKCGKDVSNKSDSNNKFVKIESNKLNSKSDKKPNKEPNIIKQMKEQGINIDVKLAKAIVSNLSSIKATGVVSLGDLVTNVPDTDLCEEFTRKVSSKEYCPTFVNLHLSNAFENPIDKYLVSNLSNGELIKVYRNIDRLEKLDSYMNDYIKNLVTKCGASNEFEVKSSIKRVVDKINNSYK